MTNRILRGYYRDKAIIDLVEQCGALDTDQIASLMFRDIKASQRKAQERLLKLVKRGMLNRQIMFAGKSYVYYLGKISGRLDHLIALNWVYIWLTQGLRSWESLYRWEKEIDYKILQTDGFFVAKNNMVDGRYRMVLIEIDLSEQNDFDKVKLYCKLFESEGYGDKWWVPLAKTSGGKFPTVLFVTTTERRKKHIIERIARENTSNLLFDVRLLDDLRREVIPWQSS